MNIGMFIYSTFRQCNTYRVWRNLAVHKANDFSLLFTPVDDATDDNNVINWCGVAYQRIKNIVGHLKLLLSPNCCILFQGASGHC